MQRNPNATCSNCPYWDRVDPVRRIYPFNDPEEEQQEEGVCRYAAPTQERILGLYTDPISWCGRHPEILGQEEQS